MLEKRRFKHAIQCNSKMCVLQLFCKTSKLIWCTNEICPYRGLVTTFLFIITVTSSEKYTNPQCTLSFDEENFQDTKLLPHNRNQIKYLSIWRGMKYYDLTGSEAEVSFYIAWVYFPSRLQLWVIYKHIFINSWELSTKTLSNLSLTLELATQYYCSLKK